MAIPPRRIALSGGGMKGLSHIGGLIGLERHGLLKFVKEYIGTSAGALLSFCVVIGYTFSELRTLSILLNFSLCQNLDPDNIFNFTQTCGLDDGKNVKRFISILLHAKGYSEDITFAEFYAKNPKALNLRIFAVDITNHKSAEFSLLTSPSMKIATALQASMCIPFLFIPVEDSESKYVDGGIVFNFPFHYLTTEERIETIGLAFDDTDMIPTTSDTPIMSYMYNIYKSIYTPQNEILKNEWEHRIIYIPCSKYSSIVFDASEEIKMAMISSGEKAVDAFVLKGAGRGGGGRRKSLP
uniref:PNPLA domain-containing protein n=1 Tax=viral metagenome TaxID=1070528 RepID=A0A6C0DE36_9ZZZZ